MREGIEILIGPTDQLEAKARETLESMGEDEVLRFAAIVLAVNCGAKGTETIRQAPDAIIRAMCKLSYLSIARMILLKDESELGDG